MTKLFCDVSKFLIWIKKQRRYKQFSFKFERKFFLSAMEIFLYAYTEALKVQILPPTVGSLKGS